MAANGTSYHKNLEALASEILELSKTHQSNNGHRPQSKLVSKAQELIAAVQSPTDHTISLVISLVEASAIRTLLSFKALQSIPKEGSISLDELAITTEVQASLLARLLRVLAGIGIITLNADKTYSHTPLSEAYTGMNGMLFSGIYDELTAVMLLPEYFKEKGRKEPDGEAATTHNPNTWKHGQEGKTTFEIMEQDPEKLKNFQVLMQTAQRFRPFTGFYDFGKFATEEAGRPVFVDIGGADGTTIAKILEAHSNIKAEQCVLQDREQVVELAKTNAALPKGVQCQAHDFFQCQPVKGAKAYNLRAICHDWSDTMVIKILKNIVPAMAPDSRVLIGDNVLPESGVSGMAAAMDMMMMCIGGKERTKANFEAVLDAAGLKLDGIHPAQGEAGFAIVEASLK